MIKVKPSIVGGSACVNEAEERRFYGGLSCVAGKPCMFDTAGPGAPVESSADHRGIVKEVSDEAT